MSQRRSILTFVAVFACMSLFSVGSRGTRAQQPTYKISGRVVGGPPVLRPRGGGVDLYISLEGSETSTRPTRPAIIDEREPKRISLRARVKSDGSFTFPDVPPGTCRLLVYASDAEQKRIPTIVVKDRDLTDLRVEFTRTDAVTSSHNLEAAWSLTGPWSGVAGDPSDGTLYAAAPGDAVTPPMFAIVAPAARIRQIDFNGKVRREIATAGFRTAKIALTEFPGIAIPVFLLFNDFADGVHALDKDGNLLWSHPRTVGETDVTVVEGTGNVVISYLLAHKGIEVVDRYGKLLWDSRAIDGAWRVASGDVLGQGKPQVVAASNFGKVYLFSTEGTVLANFDPGTRATMVRVGKLSPGDSISTIFAMGASSTDAAVTVTAVTGAGKINWSAQLPSNITPPSIYSASVAPGKPWVAVGLGDGQVFVVDGRDGTIIGSIDGQSLFPEVVWATDKAGGDPRLVVSTHDVLHAFTVSAK